MQKKDTHERIRRPFAARAAVVTSLVILAAAAIAVVQAPGQAVAHPSYGQPCSCHHASKAAAVTLTVSVTTAAPAAKVKLSGTVPSDHNWNSVRIDKRLGTAAWKTWKTVALSGSTYAKTWTAPSTTGKYSFRATYLGDNNYKKSVSPTRSVTVK